MAAIVKQMLLPQLIINDFTLSLKLKCTHSILGFD